MKNKIRTCLAAFLLLSVMYSCGGNKPGEDAPSTEKKVEATPAKASAETGEEIYKRTCLACHQANGEGIAATFPPLAKSDYLTNKKGVITQIIKGRSGEMVVNGITYNNVMPPQNLSDEEIALVLNYVYSQWGNDGSTFTPEEIRSVRNAN